MLPLVCLFTFVIGTHAACFVCLFPLLVVSIIDRQQANANSNCTCHIRRDLGRRLRSSRNASLSQLAEIHRSPAISTCSDSRRRLQTLLPPHSYLLTTHHHVITQRPGCSAHAPDPGATEPAKHPDNITACGPTPTTCHDQTSKDHHPHSIHRSAR